VVCHPHRHSTACLSAPQAKAIHTLCYCLTPQLLLTSFFSSACLLRSASRAAAEAEAAAAWALAAASWAALMASSASDAWVGGGGGGQVQSN
jgi:hypothetical protein